jgi:phosphate transport system permease protein
MNSLPLFIISSVRSGQKQAIIRGYGAAALLLTLVLGLFVLTRFLARDKAARR